MVYFYNGYFFSNNEKAKIIPLIDGVMYGYGLFETIKIRNFKPIYLDEHLVRLKSSLDILNIKTKYSNEDIKNIIEALIERNRFNGALKITIVKNNNFSDLIIMMKKSNYNIKDYEKGFNLIISDVARNSTSKVARLKTTNYLENLLEFKEAKNQGFDEVIFFNEKFFLAEGAISNIFIVKNNKLYTPSLENGLLNGIMRMKVIRECGMDVIEMNITKDFLENADEV
ncbi:MAG: aminotransferase class IV, partial [Bacillota bacterium]|nr:aminotransferase class IV [Bacillota bacterium]